MGQIDLERTGELSTSRLKSRMKSRITRDRIRFVCVARVLRFDFLSDKIYVPISGASLLSLVGRQVTRRALQMGLNVDDDSSVKQ